MYRAWPKSPVANHNWRDHERCVDETSGSTYSWMSTRAVAAFDFAFLVQPKYFFRLADDILAEYFFVRLSYACISSAEDRINHECHIYTSRWAI